MGQPISRPKIPLKEQQVFKIIAAFVIPLLALYSGCSKDPDHHVLAKVNKVEITAGDLEREIDQLPFHSRAVLVSPEGQKKLLEEMIKRELLMQEAERRNLGAQPEVKARLEESRRNILLNALLTQEIRDKVKIAEAEVRAYFDKHRDELETSEVHLKQILLKDSKEAEEVRARLLKKEGFEELARQFSIDKVSGAKGGDLGYVSRGQLPPEVERAAFSLTPQEISTVIKTPRGYHIFKLVERKKTANLQYDQVKDRLRPFAEADKQRGQLDTWLNVLRSDARVKIYEARLPVSLKMGPEMPKGPADLAPGKVPSSPHASPNPSGK
jgi:peptidyl-prolyl cis-trans isomerase C